MKREALWFIAGLLLASYWHGTAVRADTLPIDRQLIERMVRALEAQAHATEELVRVTHR